MKIVYAMVAALVLLYSALLYQAGRQYQAEPKIYIIVTADSIYGNGSNTVFHIDSEWKRIR